jgi:hypothetical protein
MDGSETQDEIVHLCHLLAFSDLFLNERKPKYHDIFQICFTFTYRQLFKSLLDQHIANYAKLRKETMAENLANQKDEEQI